MYNLITPIVFLIYRRPDRTQQVFDAIAKAKPRQLFVVADGPRTLEEMEKCQATRAIIEQVNWDCDVQTNFADQNMGLRLRISSGLNWVFEQVEQAIILEDDCLPHPTFFRYCEELLEKYRDDERIMHISGDNFGYQRPIGVEDSYYFSMFAHVWGWATWRRAWAKYDVDMTTWQNPDMRQQVLSRFPTYRQRSYWESTWDLVVKKEIKTWAYQWMYACITHNGLCAMPYENQISNIGMGVDSTNTKNASSPLSNLLSKDMIFPLKHPTTIEREPLADNHITQLAFIQSMNLKSILIRNIKRFLNIFHS
jgi:hypothetical protein